MNWRSASDAEALREIAARLKRTRLNLNQTRAQLAEKAGLSMEVVARAESGKGSTLTSLVRLMRALGVEGQLEHLLADPGPSPLALAHLKGHERQRARGKATQGVGHG